MDDLLYNQVISHLHSEMQNVENKLTSRYNHSKNLSYKIQIENAIKCLEACEKFKILPQKVMNITELPKQNTGYAEYRIMNDCETENRKNWIELIDEERKELIRLLPKDIIIERKA